MGLTDKSTAPINKWIPINFDMPGMEDFFIHIPSGHKASCNTAQKHFLMISPEAWKIYGTLTPVKEGEVLYRFEPCSWRNILNLYVYDIVKYTEKGMWIVTGRYSKRFVLKKAKKRFAYPTISEALQGFLYRKRSYLKHLRRRLHDTELMIDVGRSIELGTVESMELKEFKEVNFNLVNVYFSSNFNY